ncbi:protein-associating with the carboxyl-terminal domain of ezrin [Plutella xylostella]|uniref:protein-associating with the carboxyl-terminal domain of ezrin n=1 Tax=Plutella xylostella TaxID=51655 RepID=UPI0020330FC2|nr:protein-associating with the carboxyl-terminal domain of ezrin [Plutella xylostella]
MMGNENSQLKGLEIEENPTEVTDFWAQYQATIKDSCRYFSLKSDGSVSVFKGEAVLGPLWSVSTPLEKFSNNLLKYRHPCIVRYISSWQQRSTFHLATEFVQPLSRVLSSNNALQICIGLNNILRSLVFLHEQAGMSHNNVSLSAVYVSGDGQWKLGGLQYLCSFTELTPAYLKHARIHRYDKAVDPSEDSYKVTGKVDQYAFAVLVEDVFKGCKDDEVPHLREFRKYCHDKLQNSDPAQRPDLSEVLQHSFFNHEFISIYKFLNFLPLKSNEEKSSFFSNILENLRSYDEETVAAQLGGLLLARVTLLDDTARKDVIPYIFKPNNERTADDENNGFFSLAVFKEHLKPRVLQLFGVRDSQIRLLLLTHFSKFVHVFTHEELSQQILPELLLGIKDTDDNLVAATLICLSELVPVLGADTVVGGRRIKLFTDGRPNSKNSTYNCNSKTIRTSNLPAKSLQDFSCSEEIIFQGSNNSLALPLNERPTPVGGEAIDDDVKVLESDSKIMESEEDWSDWENSHHNIHSGEHSDGHLLILTDTQEEQTRLNDNILDVPANPQSKIDKNDYLRKAALDAKKNMVDISDLDIKNQKFEFTKKGGDEFDFFADMTPVIEKPTISNVVDVKSVSTDLSSKLNFVPDLDEGGEGSEGWGDDWS